MADSNSDKAKRIKLFCPSLSKIAKISAWEDHKLDLGAISRAFGLEPSTLKLNGHFISRGVDLIAHSVTWKSLISFFSARGLSTGVDESGALIVDGKISKSGTKRAHETADEEIAKSYMHHNDEGRKPWQGYSSLFHNKMLRHSNSVYQDRDNETTEYSCVGSKRKHWLENVGPFKRSILEGNFSNTITKGGFKGRGPENPCRTIVPCGYLNENMKRAREDDMLVAATCKKAR